MNVYVFDGKHIKSVDANTLIGKKMFVKNVEGIATSENLYGSKERPEVIVFKISDVSTDSVTLDYQYSGWKCHSYSTGGDFCFGEEEHDLDDYYMYDEVRTLVRNKTQLQKYLFCETIENLKSYHISSAIEFGFEPNRLLLDVKVLGNKLPLKYKTTDMSLKIGDHVRVKEGRFTSCGGTVMKIEEYYDYFGDSSISCYDDDLYSIERHPNESNFNIEKDYVEHPIDVKHRPSKYFSKEETGRYLFVSFKNETEEKNCVLVCLKDITTVKDAVNRLITAYKTKDKEYSDIIKYCTYHGIKDIDSSLEHFVIFVIVRYYNLAWVRKKELEIDTLTIND